MRLLVSGLTGAWAREFASLGYRVGFLVTPTGSHKVESVLAVTDVYAADNDCFKGLDRVAFTRMLDRWQGVTPGPLWVNAPDVVADAKATLERFDEWQPQLRRRGLPVAMTLQDGQEDREVPWDRLDAVFVGGTTRFKLSQSVADLCSEAKRRGKLIHVGRVNSQRRMEWCARLGADTIDGSGFSRWWKLIAPGVRWMRRAEIIASEQAELF